MPNFNFRKLKAGDSLSNIFDSGYHNAIRDALKWVDAQRNKTGGGRMQKSMDDADVIWIKNTTGSTQDAFSVLGIDDTLTVRPDDNLVSFQRDSLMLGVTPTFPDHDGKFAVLLGPLANNMIGPAQIGGICAVQVEVTSGLEWYDHADVTDDDATKLTLLPSGAAQILWRETGTGTKWALVKLGKPTGDVTLSGKTDEAIAIGSEATCSIFLTWDTDGGETVEAVNPKSANIALVSGSNVNLTWVRRYRKWLAVGCNNTT